MTTIENPYWAAVEPHMGYDEIASQVWGQEVRCVGSIYGMDGKARPFEEWNKVAILRDELVRRYAWTITHPDTVAFVAEHAGPNLLDPMAGSGYWGYLLGQLGVDVLSYDCHPPASTENRWHRAAVEHVPVHQGYAAAVAAEHGAGRTLLLAWPPYDTPDGCDALRAYTGNRLIFIGEIPGDGCTGDARLGALIESEWAAVAWHVPVVWWGIHDHVAVYDRKEPR